MNWRLRRDHPAMFSLVAFCMSVGVLLVVIARVDGRNDDELLEAIDTAAKTHCEIANTAVERLKQANFRLAVAFPGQSQEELDFVDWIIHCIVPENCDAPTATTAPLEEHCNVAPPVVTSAPSGD